MDFSKEFTISEPASFTGIGVHSGKTANITLNPAGPGSGINFFKDNVKIPVDVNYVQLSPLCTKISWEGVSLGTVEHLLAACHGLGISNIEIRADAEEIPIMDGSAAFFVNRLKSLITEQDKDREFITLENIIFLKEADKFMVAIPAPELSISYFLDYPGPDPGFVYESFAFSPEKFIDQISSARTFGFYEDSDYLRQKGLALGASPENTLVIKDNYYSGPLRFPNEPAKHKVLDLLGDLTFLGKNIKAKIIAFKTGHQQHFQLVKKILENVN